MGDVAIGVDVGGTKIAAARVERQGERLVAGEVRRLPTPTAAADEVAAEVARVVADVRSADGLDDGVPVGVGVAGLLRVDGRMVKAPNTPALVGHDVPDLLRHRLGGGVTVANDVNCAAVAEHVAGAAVGRDEVVMVSLGTGIGAGLVIRGRVYVGGHGLAGEAGHIVIDPDGPDCPCGRQGCWERYASGTGFARLAAEAAADGRLADITRGLEPGTPLTGEHVMAAAHDGHPSSRALLTEFSHWVAKGLVLLAAVLDPEQFVLGGGIVEAGDLWIDEVRSAFGAQVLGGDVRPPISVALAHHGALATAIGAAHLAMAPGNHSGAIATSR